MKYMDNGRERQRESDRKGERGIEDREGVKMRKRETERGWGRGTGTKLVFAISAL